MRPLILEFAETPELANIDYSIIEYSRTKNLSVLKGTENSAISHLSLDTSTRTKDGAETSDSDLDYKFNLKRLLDTNTGSLNSTEPMDSDNDYASLKLLLDTQTITESVETTDTDK